MGDTLTEIPLLLHRSLPEKARIKWIYLIRYRVGQRFSWHVQFVASQESWEKPDRATDGTVGVDVGWRIRPDGGLRVAVWTGSDGRAGEIGLDAGWLRESRKVKRIRGERDTIFDSVREGLAAWIKPQSDLPEWFREEVKTLAAWKSPSRLARLVLRWRKERFGADVEKAPSLSAWYEEHRQKIKTRLVNQPGVYEVLEAWRRRDAHLWNYEANLREQLAANRADLYRRFAATLRREYATIKVEHMDLPKFHRLPKPEEPAKDGALTHHLRDACLSSMIQFLKESGGQTKVRAAYTTRNHAPCGHENAWADQSPLVLTCEKCGESFDQDINAARNILASTYVVSSND